MEKRIKNFENKLKDPKENSDSDKLDIKSINEDGESNIFTPKSSSSLKSQKSISSKKS